MLMTITLVMSGQLKTIEQWSLLMQKRNLLVINLESHLTLLKKQNRMAEFSSYCMTVEMNHCFPPRQKGK